MRKLSRCNGEEIACLREGREKKRAERAEILGEETRLVQLTRTSQIESVRYLIDILRR